MKVLHIVTSDYTGAGLCAKRICEAQRELNIDALLLVKEKTSDASYVIAYPKTIRTIIYKYWIKVLRKLHCLNLNTELQFEYFMKKYKFWGSLPVSKYKIHKLDIVKSADIIHLHYVDDFLDYPSFFTSIQKKIIWTQHDEAINFGISHYTNAYLKLPDKIKEIDEYYKNIKQNAILQIKDLTLVSLSKMMYRFNRNNKFTSKLNDKIIHNSVNYNSFKPINKDKARDHFKLPHDSVILLFVAADISDTRKGLRDLIKAIDLLEIKNIKICTVGLNNPKASDITNIIRLGTIKSEAELSIAYSAADFFVMPSKQEAFAQTPLEAMACGKPVIAYPCSGIEELINDENGCIAKDFSVSSLSESIAKALTISYDGKKIREYIIKEFSPEKIAKQYIEIYKQIN